jgi:hypothetical protein
MFKSPVEETFDREIRPIDVGHQLGLARSNAVCGFGNLAGDGQGDNSNTVDVAM